MGLLSASLGRKNDEMRKIPFLGGVKYGRFKNETAMLLRRMQKHSSLVYSLVPIFKSAAFSMIIGLKV